jgi:hypothetical protein
MSDSKSEKVDPEDSSMKDQTDEKEVISDDEGEVEKEPG